MTAPADPRPVAPRPDARRLGATVEIAGSGEPATRFEVWAPWAGRVEVGVVRDDGANHAHDAHDAHDAHACTRTGAGLDDRATWTVTVPGVGHGDRYRLRVDGGDWLADPVSRWQPDGVHGPSAVVDHRRFEWTDESWTGLALPDTVLYELHVGTFTPEGTFDAAIAQLPRLADLGVTTIELMPVAAFPGTRNWGYDGVFPFAVQESYGGPGGLARLVDAAHATGLAVVLDVVYNHFGPEGNVVRRFGPYFTDAHSTPWGDAVNVAEPGSDGVRRYFIENAVGWIEDFHIDGLRLDAVDAIVDPTPVPFLQELTAAVHAAADHLDRSVLVTVESCANDPRIVRSIDDRGWGADAVWNDDVHHALRVVLTGERHEYYAGYSGVEDLAAAWDQRWVYSGRHSPVFGRRHGAPAGDLPHRRLIAFSTNHDHVGNTPRGERMLAGEGPADPRHRLAAAAILLSPFTPLLFMGEEYGETAPFPYFVDHGDPDLVEAVRRGRQSEFSGADWSGPVADPADVETFRDAVLDPSRISVEPHRSLHDMYAELLHLRREVGLLTDPATTQHVTVVGDTMFVVRAGPAASASLVFNFSGSPVALREPGLAGDVVFDSHDVRWGGDGWDPTILAPWSARLALLPTPSPKF
jgi:maltooligosyltrehalose trehalohydrolase